MSEANQDHPNSGAVASAPAAPCVEEPQPLSQGELELLDHLLAMADEYRAENALHHAMEIYHAIIQGRAGTPQASQARERLMEIANGYAAAGHRHQARELYERLLWT
jgi:hypothetical protein